MENKKNEKQCDIHDVMNSILVEVETELKKLVETHEATHRYQNILQGKIYGYEEVIKILKSSIEKYCS